MAEVIASVAMTLIGMAVIFVFLAYLVAYIISFLVIHQVL